jgi:hypothetical protein
MFTDMSRKDTLMKEKQDSAAQPARKVGSFLPRRSDGGILSRRGEASVFLRVRSMVSQFVHRQNLHMALTNNKIE